MTAGRSIPGSAQERCARRALVNRLDRSGGTSAAAEMQPGEPGTTLLCRDDLLRGFKERTMAAVEPVSGESRVRCSGSLELPIWRLPAGPLQQARRERRRCVVARPAPRAGEAPTAHWGTGHAQVAYTKPIAQR
jgi:hypothetical protein